MLHLQKNNVLVLCVTVVICISTTPIAKGLDVEMIWFKTEKTYTAGILKDDPYDVGALVFGNDIVSVRVISPTGISEDLEPGPGYWYWDREEKYATLPDLYEDFPTGLYLFVLNEGLVSEDVAAVSIDPISPTGFADITNPAHDATDVPLNTTFTWNPCSGYGDYLHVGVVDLESDEDLYLDQLDINVLSWNPGLLPLSHYLNFDISVEKVILQNPETENSDPFTLLDVFQWTNSINFSTMPPLYLLNIDIKPGSDPNPINPDSNGLVPVAILSSADFDARNVNSTTVELAGAGVAIRGKDKSMTHVEDVNEDGLPDLVVQVETQSFADLGDGGTVMLTGTTFGGVNIVGYDEILIVPPDIETDRN